MVNLQPGRFLHRKADWGKFQHLLPASTRALEWDLGHLDPEGAAERFNDSFVEVATGSIPCNSGRERSSFSWSAEPAALKMSVRHALGREHDPEVREQLGAELHQCHNKYFHKVCAAKRDSWRAFV